MTAAPTYVLQTPELHRAQAEVLAAHERFIAWVAGRRLGKSVGGTIWLLNDLLEYPPDSVAWWVAPTYDLCRFGWRQLVRYANAVPGARIYSPERPTVNSRIVLPSRHELMLRSGDHPDTLRGEGVVAAVVDEAAMCLETVWTEGIYQTLGERRGRALLISTPKGSNWFKRFHDRAATDARYAAFRHPSAANPYLPRDIIIDASQDLPDAVFRQEWLAEFIADGTVFRHLDDCTWQEQPTPDGDVVVGIDVAQSSDFTVAVAADTGGTVLDLERVNQLDYLLIAERLVTFCERVGAVTVLVETNGPGAPLLDMLVNLGLPAQGFNTRGGKPTEDPMKDPPKAQLVGNLVAAFDRLEIRIPPNPVLRSELESFTMLRTPGGSLTYGAPPGMHDDCVMALAIAWYARQHAGPVIVGYL